MIKNPYTEKPIDVKRECKISNVECKTLKLNESNEIIKICHEKKRFEIAKIIFYIIILLLIGFVFSINIVIISF